MWLTLSAIVLSCAYISYLFQRGKYFYLHSFFLIPLYPAIFFIDHNGHYLVGGTEIDSVHYVAKLLPLYLNTVYLSLRFKANTYTRLPVAVVAGNVFLAYNVATSVAYAVVHATMLPVFYASYSIPLFAIFFNSRNLSDETTDIRQSAGPDGKLLQMYFTAFLFVYAASIYYSISSGITTSLLDTRGAGSIFASSSALVYCFMYAPLLSLVAGGRWPYLVTLVVGVTSLSKTALLMLPALGILLYRRLKSHFLRNLLYYSAGTLLVAAIGLMAVPPEFAELWGVKFSLDPGETFLAKAYMTRIDLYADALRTISDHPFGIGVGNFERYSHDNYRDPHNFVLTVLAESGMLVGSVFLLVVLVSFGKTLVAVAEGVFEYYHFSVITVVLTFFFAGGVLQTTGMSDLSPIYYTPFYGVALFQFVNLSIVDGQKMFPAMNSGESPR